jgi:phosphonate transport system substrate-binding protein
LIFARKDSGIRTWQDLQGKSFSQIRNTTAADLFPRVWFKRHGVEDPAGFLGELIDAGSHETSVNMVLSGEVDAGAAKDLVFQRLASVNPLVESELVVIAESQPVPDNALAVRRATHMICADCHQGDGGPRDTSLRDRLSAALLALENEPEGKDILQAIGADRFVTTRDEEYANLYSMAAELGLDFSEMP